VFRLSVSAIIACYVVNITCEYFNREKTCLHFHSKQMSRNVELLHRSSTYLRELVQTHAPPHRSSTYLSELIQTRAPPRALHSSDALLLVVPRIHTELARRTFCLAAPSTWNSLPADIRLHESILTFKRYLKTHLFKLT